MPKLNIRNTVRKVKSWQPFGKPKDDTPPENVQTLEDTIQNDDSRDIPPSSTSEEEEKDVPRNILAFRTITKMLEAIQQQRFAFEASPADLDLTEAERSELRISNAFATLAVIEHEVVAVATIRRIKLEVLVSIHTNNSNNLYKSLKQSGSAPPPPSNKYLDHLCAQNFRQTRPLSAVSPTEKPVVFAAKELALRDLDAKTMAAFTLEGDQAIGEYADEFWSHPTMARHLWILSKLLTIKDGDSFKQLQTFATRILTYVIATCYPKMNRRIQNKDVSQHYIKSLQDIKDVIFNPSNIARRVTREQNTNDRQFLCYVWDTKGLLGTLTIPRLMEQAKLARNNKLFQLYTKDTCVEFHTLLVHIVVQFRLSLSELVEARDEAGKQAADQSQMGSEVFVQKVHDVLLHGYGLQRLTKGASLKVHLKNIEVPLQSYRLRSRQSMQELGKQQRKEPDDEKQVGEDDPENDDDLSAVQPELDKASTETPLWLYCFNWLKLMIAYFDAVDDMVGYVTSPAFNHNEISVHILSTPFVDNSLLPWRELLGDSTLFPIFTERSLPAYSKDKVTTNAQITTFLEKALENSSDAFDAKTLWGKGDVTGTITKFDKIRTSVMPGWGKLAGNIYDKLKPLPCDAALEDDLDDEVREAIQLLCDSGKFIDSLNNKHGFPGSSHCEASLVSLLHQTRTAPSKGTMPLTQYGPLIGVSKRCCPVCFHLLSLLGQGESRFRVRGFHNAVTACTLPSSLPTDIVDSMNQYFGAQLRKELLDFMSRKILPRNHTESSDSSGQPDSHVSIDNVIAILNAPEKWL